MFYLLTSLASVGLTQVLGKNAGTSYIEGQWDLARFTVQSETPCVCGFLQNRKAVVGKIDTIEQHICICIIMCNRINSYVLSSTSAAPPTYLITIFYSPFSCVYGWYISSVLIHFRGSMP